MKPLLLIDNYDSFVYNLAQILKEKAMIDYKIVKNNTIPFSDLDDFSSILISPGPGIPSEAGCLMELIEVIYQQKPILGVCLGHQALAQFFGAQIFCYKHPIHGEKTKLHQIDFNSVLYQNISEGIQVGRYHSWGVSRNNFPDILKITSYDQDGGIMSMEHKYLPLYGVQYHPESYLSNDGEKIILNWINEVKKKSNFVKTF